MAHSQEATKLHIELAELKIKQTELQEIVNSASERESTFMEIISNLEAYLHSKSEEAIAAEEKRARIEERL